jgi:DNA-binding transcriptional ArsR family regulator
MKPVKVIDDPAAFELLADSTRRRIVNLLKARELTVSQIAEQLDKTPQNIYHHMRKLQEGDLVEVAREARVENFVEKYYRATAEIFEVRHGEGNDEIDEANTREVLLSMSKAGLLRLVDDAIVSRAIKLLKQARKVSFGPELQKRLEHLNDADLAIKLHTADYAPTLLMTDREFDDFQKLQGELRDLLTKRPSSKSAC